MNRWRQDITCLQCGGTLGHVNGTTNGVLSVAVVKCSSCGRQYEVTTRLRAFTSAA